MGKVSLLMLCLWLGCATAIGGLLLASHAALPVPPSGSQRLRIALEEVTAGQQGWRAVHVLYRACECSRRALSHLAASQRPAGVMETVLVVDDEQALGAEARAQERELRARGFRVVALGREALRRRFGLEAAPVFAVLRPDGDVGYLGGYTRSKQGPVLEDVQIIDALRADHVSSPLPTYGCATSARLANRLDPLGLRRW